MAHETHDEKQKDITSNWVTSSRFLFYVQLFLYSCVFIRRLLQTL